MARSDRHERTRPGNPHRLTIDQHTLPAASIVRFCGPDGRVVVHDLLRNKVRRAGPRDDIFCAKRAWDHGSEIGFMWRIEAAFQDLANRIVDRQVSLGVLLTLRSGRVWRFAAQKRRASA